MASSSQNGISGALARFHKRSYPAIDYLALACIIGGWFLVNHLATPFHRMFSLDSKSIQYPHAAVERVSVAMSMIYAGLIPLLILLAWGLLFRPPRHYVQVTILGFFMSLFLTSLLTDIIKNAVGRPRPDLLSRCIPKKGTPETSWVTWTVCSQPNLGMLHDGWRSFPSGHSSFSFGGLGYLTLFLAGQMRVFRPRSDFCRCLLAFVPVACAALVAISRLDDYRHDIYDVTAGSILGSSVAYFSYRRYYPALRSVSCDVPYDREDAVNADGFSKLPHDEEQQVPGQDPVLRRWDGDEEVYQLGDASAAHGR